MDRKKSSENVRLVVYTGPLELSIHTMGQAKPSNVLCFGHDHGWIVN